MAEGPAAAEEDLDALRAALVAAGRRMGARGLVSAGEGNLSLRLTRGRLLVTPSGRRKDELSADDLLVVSLDPAGDEAMGSVSSGAALRPTSDLAIHRAVHVARPDVTAVVHAHPPATLALTLAGERADPTTLPETALLLPRLPFVPYGTPGSVELAGRIGAALGEPPAPGPGAVLLERHGAVAVGSGPPEQALGQALDRLELVEVLCRATGEALLLRAGRAALDRPPSA